MLQSAEPTWRTRASTSARLDARAHARAHASGVGRLEMYLQHERRMEEAELERFRPLLRRRAKREPLQYILGRQAFRELELEVGPGVLIPQTRDRAARGSWCSSWCDGREELVGPRRGDGDRRHFALSLLSEGPFSRFVSARTRRAEALAFAQEEPGRRTGMESLLELRAGSLVELRWRTESVSTSWSPTRRTWRRASRETRWSRRSSTGSPSGALFAGHDGLGRPAGDRARRGPRARGGRACWHWRWVTGTPSAVDRHWVARNGGIRRRAAFTFRSGGEGPVRHRRYAPGTDYGDSWSSSREV